MKNRDITKRTFRKKPLKPAGVRLIFAALVAAALVWSSGPAAQSEESNGGYSVGYRETGEASWYGPDFQGQRTASGEPYNMNDLTAAHRELPFGLVVAVTNLANKKATLVRINDRGPYNNRIIDLSLAAAREIGLDQSGAAPVNLEVVGWAGDIDNLAGEGQQVKSLEDFFKLLKEKFSKRGKSQDNASANNNNSNSPGGDTANAETSTDPNANPASPADQNQPAAPIPAGPGQRVRVAPGTPTSPNVSAPADNTDPAQFREDNQRAEGDDDLDAFAKNYANRAARRPQRSPNAAPPLNAREARQPSAPPPIDQELPEQSALDQQDQTSAAPSTAPTPTPAPANQPPGKDTIKEEDLGAPSPPTSPTTPAPTTAPSSPAPASPPATPTAPAATPAPTSPTAPTPPPSPAPGQNSSTPASPSATSTPTPAPAPAKTDATSPTPAAATPTTTPPSSASTPTDVVKAGLEHGNASWFDKEKNGKTSAYGEVIDSGKLVAFHATLPFGTKVRVVSLDTGKAVEVRIIDRCDASGDKVIEISRAAAVQLGIQEYPRPLVTIEAIGN